MQFGCGILGCVFMVLAVFMGLYMGVWWAFIGGIIQVILQIRAPEMDVTILAYGIAKIVFAAPIGWISAIVPLMLGSICLEIGKK